MRAVRCVIGGILLLALGCGETEQVTAGNDAQKQLSKETFQQIVRLSNMAAPWAPCTPAEVNLRKRLFDYEDKLIRADQRVCRPGPYADKLADVLSMETSGPASVQVGRAPEIKATLRNLGKDRLRLPVWGQSWRSELVSSSGRLLKLLPPVEAKAARGSAVLMPRPEDYVTLAPGESLPVEVPLRRMWPFMPPGRYHVTVWYHVDPRIWRKPHEHHLTTELAGRTMAIEFTEGPELAGLACALTCDKTQIAPGEKLTFDCTIRNTTKNRYLAVASNHTEPALSVGALTIRNPATGQTLHLPQPRPRKAHPDGYPPWYRRESAYLRLKPGEQLRTRLLLDGALWKRHADFLQPGRTYEVALRYENNHDWYLRDGQVRHFGNAWFGRIASRAVRVTVNP